MMADQTFDVVFNSTWNSPLALLSTSQNPVSLIIVNEPGTLTFNARGGVTFPPAGGPTAFYPFQILVGEQAFEASSVSVTNDSTTLSVTIITPPPSTVQPLIFQVMANVPGVNGLLSNRLYATPNVNLTPPPTMSLQYNTTNGIFTLSDGWVLEPGELILFLRGFSSEPLTYTIQINLTDQNNQPLNFANPPIVWTASPSPGWLTWEWPGLETNSFQLSNAVNQNFGIAMPFRFVIEYGELQVSSPDPIIMNATIGDG